MMSKFAEGAYRAILSVQYCITAESAFIHFFQYFHFDIMINIIRDISNPPIIPHVFTAFMMGSSVFFGRKHQKTPPQNMSTLILKERMNVIQALSIIAAINCVSVILFFFNQAFFLQGFEYVSCI